MRKQRITVSIDPALVAAAMAAVTEGRAESVSSWVSDAIADRAVRDGRLRALASAVAAYEAEHGQIDTAELADQARADRDAAAAVRIDASGRSGVA